MLQLKTNPCIAILRGLQPSDATNIGQLLYQHGIKIMEVPLNRSNAFESIEVLQSSLPNDCIIGAGTVTNLKQLKRLNDMEIKLAISPNTDVEIIKAAANFGMIHTPGVATPSEAYVAYNNGSRLLKLFPASTYGVNHLKALLSILPKDTDIVAVGGINETNMVDWIAAGAIGVGIGNNLYSEGDSLEISEQKIKLFAHALKQIK